MSTHRLVIRIKLIPQQPPPRTRLQLSRNVLLPMLGAAVVLLGWFAISSFKPAPPAPAPAPIVSASPPPTPIEKEVPPEPEAPTAAINQVIPNVPQSALETIRGTVRVVVRLTIDKQGTVVGTVAEDRGPSRYFERLAVKAAKQWTFTPTRSDAQRTLLVKFNFTRGGATAEAGSATPSPSF